MFENLELFQMAGSMAVHAASRQQAAAENAANADTPGYRARDAAPFADVFRDMISQPDTGLRQTRAGHLPATETAMPVALHDTGAAAAPNGNSVSLETEMLRAAEIRGQHDRALAIYRSGLTVLRTALGRG